MSANESRSDFERLILIITFIGVFMILTDPVVLDTWWHLRSGEDMVMNKHILLEDHFSYTRAGTPWVNAFWLADIVLYIFFDLGGFFALSAFIALMGVATFWVANKQVQLPTFVRALLLVLVAFTASSSWTTRPQVFSFFLLAFLDFWLSKLKTGEKKNFWLLPPLFALWANLHGGYIWGLLLLIAVLVGELFNHWIGDQAQKDNALAMPVLKKLFIFTVLAFLAVLANPNGIQLWILPFHTVDVSLSIQEWLSINFHDISAHPMLWMLFLFIFTLANNTKKLSFSDLFKVLGFTYMAFISRRNITPYAIILFPVLAEEISFFWKTNTPLRSLLQRLGSRSQMEAPASRIIPLLNGVLILVVFLMAFVHAYFSSLPSEIADRYPSKAVDWIIENQPDGALFNSYDWGGYLIWNLRQYPVFIDGRADLYGNEIIGQWDDVVNGGEDAQQILDDWDVRLILLEPQWSIVNELPHYGWELYYQDEISVIYGR